MIFTLFSLLATAFAQEYTLQLTNAGAFSNQYVSLASDGSAVASTSDSSTFTLSDGLLFSSSGTSGPAAVVNGTSGTVDIDFISLFAAEYSFTNANGMLEYNAMSTFAVCASNKVAFVFDTVAAGCTAAQITLVSGSSTASMSSPASFTTSPTISQSVSVSSALAPSMTTGAGINIDINVQITIYAQPNQVFSCSCEDGKTTIASGQMASLMNNGTMTMIYGHGYVWPQTIALAAGSTTTVSSCSGAMTLTQANSKLTTIQPYSAPVTKTVTVTPTAQAKAAAVSPASAAAASVAAASVAAASAPASVAAASVAAASVAAASVAAASAPASVAAQAAAVCTPATVTVTVCATPTSKPWVATSAQSVAASMMSVKPAKSIAPAPSGATPPAVSPKLVTPEAVSVSAASEIVVPPAGSTPVVTPAAVTPAAVTPAAVSPAAVTPAAVSPAAVTPAAVSPAAVTPAAVPAQAECTTCEAAAAASVPVVSPAAVTPAQASVAQVSAAAATAAVQQIGENGAGKLTVGFGWMVIALAGGFLL